MRRVTLGVLILSLLAFAGNANATLNVTITNSPYNATGNGTTNDRVAIQNAINDVNAAGGGVVTLPFDKTFLSGNLRLKSNVTLTISGTLLQSQNTSHYDYSGYKSSLPNRSGDRRHNPAARRERISAVMSLVCTPVLLLESVAITPDDVLGLLSR